MGTQQKVAIITGASQGIGADLVKGFRDRNYRVVANSRSIKPSSDPDILAVPGDIADPAAAQRVVAQAIERFGRIDTLVNNAGIFIAKPFTAVHAMKTTRKIVAINLGGFFHITQARRRRNAEAEVGPHRADHDQPRRPRQRQRAVGARLTDQGRPERGDEVARDRIRKARHPRQRGVARHHQDPDACARDARVPVASCIRSAAWAMSRDIVDAVLYLENAGFVTGEILHVDGGQSAGH